MSEMFEDYWNHGTQRIPPHRREAHYWTVFEASRVLGLTQPAIRKIVRANPGLSLRIGGRLMINRAALKEFFRRRSDPDDAGYEGLRRA